MEKGNKRRGTPDSKRAPGEKDGRTGLTKGTSRKREGSTALYQKFETYIPRNEIAQPRSQFYVQVAVSDLYIPTIGPLQTDGGNIYMAHRYANVETGRQNIIILFWK